MLTVEQNEELTQIGPGTPIGELLRRYWYPIAFEQAVFVTCREAHALPVEARQRIGYFLAEFSARFRGVTIPEDERGAQLAMLVRGGCTLSPDAHLFAVIDKAILAEQAKLPKRQ